MPRHVKPLTELKIKAAKPARSKETGKIYAALHADGGGLYLHVAPATGADADEARKRAEEPKPVKSWIFRYRDAAGDLRDMGLGSLGDLGLAEAREAAGRWRRVLREGQDPIAARKAERDAARLAAARGMPFKDCAEAYITSRRDGWHNEKHATQWSTTLDDVCLSGLWHPAGAGD